MRRMLAPASERPAASGSPLAILVCVVAAHRARRSRRRRPFRIGVLNAAWAASHPTVEGLKAGLKELGFEDGRDVTFDIRFTEGKLDAMPAAAEALVKAGVDLIFTSQEAATQAAKDATESVPIVFTLVGDPVGAGIVSKLAQPGGNVTGVSSLQTELVAKRLEVLKTLAPAVRRVWLIYYGVDLSTTPMIAKALEAAQRMKLEVVPKGVLDAGELKRVLREVRRDDARARAGRLEPGSRHRDHRAVAGPARSRPSSGRRSGSAMAVSCPTAPTTTRRASRPPRWSPRSCGAPGRRTCPSRAPRRSISR